MIYMIVATDKKHLIGKDNTLPWHNSEELKFFKESTAGATLLVGYNTYKSLPPLPNRKIIVLTSHFLEGVTTISVKELNQLFDTFRTTKEILFIAGGKKVYESFYQEAELIYHSIVDGEYVGDTYLEIDYKNYSLVKEEHFNTFKLSIYKKKQ